MSTIATETMTGVAPPATRNRWTRSEARADQVRHLEGKNHFHWLAPIVADAEAGFGGPLNVFELVKSMIEVGAAGVHLEDQLASKLPLSRRSFSAESFLNA